MTVQETKMRPAWHVRIEPSSRYVANPVFRATVALLNPADDRLTVCDYLAELDHLRDFAVTASIEASADGNRLWGYQHEYAEPRQVDLHRAEAMVKTLRRVSKGLTSHEERFGYLGRHNAVGYLAIIASVLNIAAYVVQGEHGQDGRWRSGQRYQLLDAAGLKTVITSRVEKLVLP